MKNTPTHTERIGNFILNVFYDDDANSPREWDNLGTMLCFHRRYTLGDKNPFSANDFDSWEELENILRTEENAHTILPLSLYDHSGISMSVGGPSCAWDSGQVGFIYVTKEKVEAEGIDGSKVEEYLRGEVEAYNQYLTEDVFRYEISRVSVCDHGCEHTELVDSCGGYFGEDYCIEEAKSALNYYATA